MAGHPLGTVITMPLSGLLADAFGWEYDFYFFGATALAFSILWLLLVHESPSQHLTIDEVLFFMSLENILKLIHTN